MPLITLAEDPDFARRFPAERWARVRITLADGRALVSDPARARGNPENPLDDDELRVKFHALADPVLGAARGRRMRESTAALTTGSSAFTCLLDV